MRAELRTPTGLRSKKLVLKIFVKFDNALQVFSRIFLVHSQMRRRARNGPLDMSDNFLIYQDMVMKHGKLLCCVFCWQFWGLALHKTFKIQKVVMLAHSTNQ